MITVGYGDILPINNSEKIFVVVMTIGSCANFAYTVNTIGSIFQNLAEKKALLNKEKYIMLNYMKNRSI